MNLKQLSGGRKVKDARTKYPDGLSFKHSNLTFYGTKLDRYGNNCFILGFPNGNKFTIQTGYEWDFGTGSVDDFIEYNINDKKIFKDIDDMESFFVDLVQQKKSRGQRLNTYEDYTPSDAYDRFYHRGKYKPVSDSRKRVSDSEGNWTLWLYDVWGNDEDGYEVNDRREVARGLNIKDTVTDDIILDILKLYKVVKRSTTLNDISIGYDENAVYVDDANGKPLCEIVNDEYDEY